MQDTGLNRQNKLDKYYTKPEVVETCYNLIRQNLKINKKDTIIEPSAGNGAFIEIIKRLTKKYKFYDIKPEHTEVMQQDFLELNNNIFITNSKKVHIIGNPPFGRQSSLAIKFIKKVCQFADSISFILPKSFKKDSLKKNFPLNYHLIVEQDIQTNSFLINNTEIDVPCVFQIWLKKDINRQEINKLEPDGFIFVDIKDKPDISVRRVGVYAGKVSEDTDKSIQSHYFIKILKNNKNEIIEKLKLIQFDNNNTVGPRSISKQELIKKYNNLNN